MTRYNDMPAEQVEYSVTNAPSAELLTVAELRVHLRLPDFPDAADATEDAYLTSLIKAAGDSIELTVRRPIRPQSRDLILPSFPSYTRSVWGSNYWFGGYYKDAIILDITPIREVTAIRYRLNDEVITMPPADYRVEGTGEHITRRVEIYPADNKTWPCDDYDGEVVISVDCGFTQSNIPQNIKHAAQVIAGDLYNFRGEVVTGTIVAPFPRSAKYLLQQFTRMSF